MKKYLPYLMLMVVLAAATSVFAQGNYYDTNIDIDLQYRNMGQYFVNGEPRTILMDKPWGAIVYSPQKMGNININSSFSDMTLTSDLGTVTVNDKKGDINIVCPNNTISLEGNRNGGYIEFKGKRYNVDLSDHKMTIDVPGDTITYTSGPDWLEISGNKGTTRYQKDSNGFTVTSDKGTTTYKAMLNGGYEYDGIPGSSHPYYYWGVEFFDTDSQVGVILEFNRLVPFPTLPSGMRPAKCITVR